VVVDLREQVREIPTQTSITKDKRTHCYRFSMVL
jgi:hypothetical protein